MVMTPHFKSPSIKHQIKISFLHFTDNLKWPIYLSKCPVYYTHILSVYHETLSYGSMEDLFCYTLTCTCAKFK